MMRVIVPTVKKAVVDQVSLTDVTHKSTHEISYRQLMKSRTILLSFILIQNKRVGAKVAAVQKKKKKMMMNGYQVQRMHGNS